MLHKYWLMSLTLMGQDASKSCPRFLEHWLGKILMEVGRELSTGCSPSISIFTLNPGGGIVTSYGLCPTVH